MDIYQILTEYNNPWSSREIFCFSCIMVIAVIMMIYLLRKEKMNKLQAAAILAELVFLGIVFGSTVFTRTGSVRQCELIPFWSWSAILRYHDMELLKENLLNCILLLPAGAADHESEGEMAGGAGIWRADISYNRNEPTDHNAWIVRMG